MMKNALLFSLIFVMSIINTFGQSDKKPKLNKAESLLKTDKIDEAKEIVDLAITHEKTKDDPKAFYLRALVYVVLDTAKAHKGKVNNAIEIAVDCFNKAMEMTKDDKNELYITEASGLPVTISQHLNNYWAYYFNRGANAYEAKDFPNAVKEFTNSQIIKPADTNSYINAGYAAQNYDNFEDAKKNYLAAIKNGAKSKDLYNLLIYIYSEKDKNFEKALDIIKQAKVYYPIDNELSRNEISLLIKSNKVEDAKLNLENQIKTEPDDPNLYFTLGILYEELAKNGNAEENNNKAIEAYKKAASIDPKHYNSQYNIGVMIISKANILIKEKNSLGISKAELQKAKELEPKINSQLEVALAQWEIIHNLDPNDKPTLETLLYLYTQLKKYDEAEKINAKIDELKK